jgi:hypothetical protein
MLRKWIWLLLGARLPPPHPVKQDVLVRLAQRFRLKTFVETGTYHGRMIGALFGVFDKAFSIELSVPLYERAKDRFRDNPHVELIQGDSGQQLKLLLPRLKGPALFWLDGHYSGGITALGAKVTPILEELDHILAHHEKGHVIVIDDARLFGVADSGYPTIQELNEHVRSKRDDLAISVDGDSIRITPPAPAPD